MIHLKNWEESKTISELEYITYVVKNDIDDYPVNEMFVELAKTDSFFRYWGIKTEGLKISVNYKNECDGEKVLFNADLNVFIKRALKNKDWLMLEWAKLLKFFSLIENANKCKYYKYQNDKLVEDLIRKKVSPVEYTDKILGIKFESLLISLYATLSYIIHLESENKPYLMQYFIDDLLPSFFLEDTKTTPENLLQKIKSILENKDNEYRKKFMNENKDLYKSLIKQAEDIYS